MKGLLLSTILLSSVGDETIYSNDASASTSEPFPKFRNQRPNRSARSLLHRCRHSTHTHTHTQKKKKKERKIKSHREIFFILFYYNYYSADITFAHTEYYICYTDYRAQPHSHRLPPAIRLHPWCAHGVKVAKMEMMITTWEKWTLDSRDRENIDDSSFVVVFFFLHGTSIILQDEMNIHKPLRFWPYHEETVLFTSNDR